MRSDRWNLALAGGLAAAASLAVSELLASFLTGGRSVLLSVGDEVIDLSPGWLQKWAIRTFGTNDKTVLFWSMVVVIVVLGVLAGLAASRSLAGGGALFAGAALLGGWASWRDPQSLASAGAVAVISGAAVGFGLLVVLRRPVQDEPTDRRQFLTMAGGATAFTVAAALIGRARAMRVIVALNRSEVVLPAPTSGAGPVPTAIGPEGVASLITPNSEFYLIDTALSIPTAPLDEWQMEISGMVDRPYTLSYAELLSLPMIERHITISCVSNRVGGNLVGTATWLGVPLSRVLEMAGVQEGATQIVGRSMDGWTAGFPTEVAFDGRDAMVAIAMNGEPLPIRHGFPARLVVPGLYGYVSATKWLAEIELTTWESFDAYWVPRGWSKEGPVKTMSRIDAPRNFAAVEIGQVGVGGVAWAPHRGIGRVELRVDEGPWIDADLSEPLTDDAWRQWAVVVDLAEGEHELQVRAYDGDGEQQPLGPADPDPNGAEGWHRIKVVAQ